jgi:hypothetical protein
MVLWSASTVLPACMHYQKLLKVITGSVLASLQQLDEDHRVSEHVVCCRCPVMYREKLSTTQSSKF